MPLFHGRLPFSGQRRLLQSGAAMKRHRNFLIVESTRRGGLSRRHKEGWSLSKAQGGDWSLLIGEGFGGSPKKIFKFKMSVEAILMNFEAIFSCENKLILQA